VETTKNDVEAHRGNTDFDEEVRKENIWMGRCAFHRKEKCDMKTVGG
jgi:hypothetical protein